MGRTGSTGNRGPLLLLLAALIGAGVFAYGLATLNRRDGAESAAIVAAAPTTVGPAPTVVPETAVEKAQAAKSPVLAQVIRRRASILAAVERDPLAHSAGTLHACDRLVNASQTLTVLSKPYHGNEIVPHAVLGRASAQVTIVATNLRTVASALPGTGIGSGRAEDAQASDVAHIVASHPHGIANNKTNSSQGSSATTRQLYTAGLACGIVLG